MHQGFNFFPPDLSEGGVDNQHRQLTRAVQRFPPVAGEFPVRRNGRSRQVPIVQVQPQPGYGLCNLTGEGSNAMLFRMSSESGSNVSPQGVSVGPGMSRASSAIQVTSVSWRVRSLTAATSPSAMGLLTALPASAGRSQSFGGRLPPKPIPGLRRSPPIRKSASTAPRTEQASVPGTDLHRPTVSLTCATRISWRGGHNPVSGRRPSPGTHANPTQSAQPRRGQQVPLGACLRAKARSGSSAPSENCRRDRHRRNHRHRAAGRVPSPTGSR